MTVPPPAEPGAIADFGMHGTIAIPRKQTRAPLCAPRRRYSSPRLGFVLVLLTAVKVRFPVRLMLPPANRSADFTAYFGCEHFVRTA